MNKEEKQKTISVLVGLGLVLLLMTAPIAFANQGNGRGPQGGLGHSQGVFHSPSQAIRGSGAPGGPHFDVNVVGLAKGGSHGVTNMSHVIFVPLYGSCMIQLVEGAFAVASNNCISGAAVLHLPNPNDTGTGMLSYSVWARATSAGSSTAAACSTDLNSSATFCDTGALLVSLSKSAPPKFGDVSGGLLQTCASGNLTAIFSNSGFSNSWNYTNSGLHLLQLRFYPIETTSSGGAC
ncbi:MAG: hypothetical protein HY297_04015 [Thaumarchaeota archaeon]|nr:hypothetical protein [Nitrososphaerota archaeon]